MSLTEIAQTLELCYKDFDDIQGLIENEKFDEAKKKALDSMKMLEYQVI